MSSREASRSVVDVKTYFVYIMTNQSRTLYVGMTNNLGRRVAEHKEGKVPGFTRRYRAKQLVYLEEFRNVRDAIAREKHIKGWRREKKIALIESMNPRWDEIEVLA